MASVQHQQSYAISDVEASPATVSTAGEGASAQVHVVQGYVTVAASGDVDSTYQLVRVPSNAKIQMLTFQSQAQTAGTFDIGVYYATDGRQGKPTSLLASAAIDQDYFATAIVCSSAVNRTDITFESGTNTPAKQQMPLWQAIGLTSDPRCKLDIVATVVTTAVTTGTGQLGVQCWYAA